MNRSALLAKTPKGVEELKSRAHGLAQKLRALLIMIDGTATAGDLVAKFGAIPDVEAGLQALVDQGFVEVKAPGTAAGATRVVAPPAPTAGSASMPGAVTSAGATPATATSAAANPAAPEGPSAVAPSFAGQTRVQAVSSLSRYLIDNLGPDADDLTARLEQARTAAEFGTVAEQCADMLAAIRGQAKAQVFRDRARALGQHFFAGK
jgi:hypothetical protein